MEFGNIDNLLEDIENILGGLMVSGFGVVQESTLEEMRRTARNCEKFGLIFAASTMLRLTEGLEEKRHNLNYDIRDLVKDFCVLSTYTSVGKGKLKVEKVKEMLEADMKVAGEVAAELEY